MSVREAIVLKGGDYYNFTMKLVVLMIISLLLHSTSVYISQISVLNTCIHSSKGMSHKTLSGSHMVICPCLQRCTKVSFVPPEYIYSTVLYTHGGDKRYLHERRFGCKKSSQFLPASALCYHLLLMIVNQCQNMFQI